MTTQRSEPDMYVMDTLANDIEDLDSILRMLNSDTVLGWSKEWGRPFTHSDVVEALNRLIRRDLVQVLVYSESGNGLEAAPRMELPPGDYADAYYALTPRGRVVHSTWAAADAE